MLRRTIITTAVLGLMVALPAQATYTSIQANLLDGVPETDYTAGVLTIDSASVPTTQLTLNDPDPLLGTVTDMDLDLVTYFNYVFMDGETVKSIFTGGNFSLTFNYDSSPYYIEGPISNMVFYVSSATPSLSYIAGEGLFQAAYELPGSDNWPAPLQSSIKSLTLAFGCDLGEFDWAEGALDCPLETLMTLYPDNSAAPGPAALLLLIPGAALLRRR